MAKQIGKQREESGIKMFKAGRLRADSWWIRGHGRGFGSEGGKVSDGFVKGEKRKEVNLASRYKYL
jgi:hypothetical protein